MKKINILQLITAILFAVIILILIISLYLIWFSNFHINTNDSSSNFKNGFQLLKDFGLSYVLSHSANFFISLAHYSDSNNYYPWIQLQIGVIFFCNYKPNFAIYSNYIYNNYLYFQNKTKK